MAALSTRSMARRVADEACIPFYRPLGPPLRATQWAAAAGACVCCANGTDSIHTVPPSFLLYCGRRRRWRSRRERSRVSPQGGTARELQKTKATQTGGVNPTESGCNADDGGVGGRRVTISPHRLSGGADVCGGAEVPVGHGRTRAQGTTAKVGEEKRSKTKTGSRRRGGGGMGEKEGKNGALDEAEPHCRRCGGAPTAPLRRWDIGPRPPAHPKAQHVSKTVCLDLAPRRGAAGVAAARVTGGAHPSQERGEGAPDSGSRDAAAGAVGCNP